MTSYRVNEAGVRHAEQLIRSGKFDTETKWSEAAASAGEENEVIDDDGYKAWSEWHLAEDTDAGEGTKGRFRFPYGDFDKVNRAALIHAKQRASQNDHGQIEKAADRLLQQLDQQVEKKGS
ncbi:MAG TPA: hypothetical protein VFH58_12050 [Acidimicrobiales bacterium]|nr:hypothetical protein [Acidimicrobiales bacterium]